MLFCPIGKIKRPKLDRSNNGLDNVGESALAVLRDMALFVAVAETGSFVSAAKRLGMPASTLSWRISAFEKTIGTKLFNRTTRKVSLTTTGWLHLERCRHVVRDAQSLTDAMRAQSQAPRGRIRISTTGDFAISLLSPHLPEFVRRYPEISLDLDTSAARVDLLAENLDVAIRMGNIADPNLVVRHLMDAHLNLFASPAYLREAGIPNSPSELPLHKMVKTGPTPGEMTLNISKESERIQMKLDARFWSNQMALTRTLLLQSLGIGVLVEELFQSDIQAGRLVRVLPDWSLAVTAVSVVVPHRQAPAATKVFVEYLLEKFSEPQEQPQLVREPT